MTKTHRAFGIGAPAPIIEEISEIRVCRNLARALSNEALADRLLNLVDDIRAYGFVQRQAFLLETAMRLGSK